MTLRSWTMKLARALAEVTGQRVPRHEHVTAALVRVGPPPPTPPAPVDHAAAEAAYRAERGWT